MSDEPFKYWNGYSWREHRPGFYGIDRSVHPVSLLGCAPALPPFEELFAAGVEAVLRSGESRPVVSRSVIVEPSPGCDHPGEPCIVGGPLANHGW